MGFLHLSFATQRFVGVRSYLVLLLHNKSLPSSRPVMNHSEFWAFELPLPLQVEELQAKPHIRSHYGTFNKISLVSGTFAFNLESQNTAPAFGLFAFFVWTIKVQLSWLVRRLYQSTAEELVHAADNLKEMFMNISASAVAALHAIPWMPSSRMGYLYKFYHIHICTCT